MPVGEKVGDLKIVQFGGEDFWDYGFEALVHLPVLQMAQAHRQPP